MKVFISGIDPTARRNQLAALIEEFYNQNHDKSGRFAPSVGGRGKTGSFHGPNINKISILGPTSRLRKGDLKKLTDDQLRDYHAHLETNSRKWGAVLLGFTIAASLATGVVFGAPYIGSSISTAAGAYVTRAKERFSVGREAQRRGLHLSFNTMEGFQFQGKTAEDELKAFTPDVEKMSPGEMTKGLNAGLQAVKDLLSDPEEELSKGERKALEGGQAAIEQALKVGRQ